MAKLNVGTVQNKTIKSKRNTKAIMLLLGVIILLSLLVYASVYLVSKPTYVVGLKEDTPSATTLTNSDFIKIGFVRSTYLQAASTDNKLYTWSDRSKLVGKKLSVYGLKNMPVYSSMVANKQTATWMQQLLTDGTELITVPIGTDSSLDTRMLLPGATLRVRILGSVPSAQYGQLAAMIDTEESQMQSQIASTGTTDMTGTVLLSQSLSMTTTTTTVGSTQIAETLLPQIQVVDLLNSTNQSLYDIYSALASMPAETRNKYISKQFENNSSSDFTTKLQPTQMVFVAKTSLARQLTELGQTSQLRFSILPQQSKGLTPAQETMQTSYSQFASIADSIAMLQASAGIQ